MSERMLDYMSDCMSGKCQNICPIENRTNVRYRAMSEQVRENVYRLSEVL